MSMEMKVISFENKVTGEFNNKLVETEEYNQDLKEAKENKVSIGNWYFSPSWSNVATDKGWEIISEGTVQVIGDYLKLETSYVGD